MKVEDKLYKHLGAYKAAPPLVKKAAALVYNRLPSSVRYGRQYRHFADLLKRSKSWTRVQIEAYQLERLNSLLRAAKAHVPHYREALRGVSLPLESLAAFREQVPFTTKEQVRANNEAFLNERFPRSELLVIATGGTTGEPLRVYYEKGTTRAKELVYMNDMWSRVGYEPGDRRAVFRSTLIRDRANDRLWEYDPIKNRYFFSSYDLTEENIARYLDKLREIQPKYLHVYPSTLTILASYMKAHGIGPIPGVRGLLCGSENTYPHQIRLFEGVFQCRVMRWYGLAEMSALAGSSEYDYDYHPYPTYSYVELVDEHGQPITEEGQTGEIVGTTFDNEAMPLIRYRTGDLAVYGGEDYRGPVFKEIEGRAQEHIVDDEGNLLSLGPFVFGIHEEFWHNVTGIQFVQEEEGKLEIRGTSRSLSEDALEAYLRKTFTPRFENSFEIDVRVVNGFERTRTGKHQYLIQRLDLDTRAVRSGVSEV